MLLMNHRNNSEEYNQKSSKWQRLFKGMADTMLLGNAVESG